MASDATQHDPMSNLPHMSPAYDPHGASGGGADGPDKSESQYLTRQASDAGAAISRVAEEITHSLARGADPRAWAKHYPWATVAVAAAAGFAAAAALVPGKEERALKKLVEIERALGIGPGRKRSKDEDDSSDNGKADKGARDYAEGKTSFLGGLARQAMEAVKPALLSALSAGITAKAAQPSSSDDPPHGPADAYAQSGSNPSSDPSGGI